MPTKRTWLIEDVGHRSHITIPPCWCVVGIWPGSPPQPHESTCPTQSLDVETFPQARVVTRQTVADALHSLAEPGVRFARSVWRLLAPVVLVAPIVLVAMLIFSPLVDLVRTRVRNAAAHEAERIVETVIFRLRDHCRRSAPSFEWFTMSDLAGYCVCHLSGRAHCVTFAPLDDATVVHEIIRSNTAAESGVALEQDEAAPIPIASQDVTQ